METFDQLAFSIRTLCPHVPDLGDHLLGSRDQEHYWGRLHKTNHILESIHHHCHVKSHAHVLGHVRDIYLPVDPLLSETTDNDTVLLLSSTDLVFFSLSIACLALSASTESALERLPRLGSSRSSRDFSTAIRAKCYQGPTDSFTNGQSIIAHFTQIISDYVKFWTL